MSSSVGGNHHSCCCRFRTALLPLPWDGYVPWAFPHSQESAKLTDPLPPTTLRVRRGGEGEAEHFPCNICCCRWALQRGRIRVPLGNNALLPIDNDDGLLLRLQVRGGKKGGGRASSSTSSFSAVPLTREELDNRCMDRFVSLSVNDQAVIFTKLPRSSKLSLFLVLTKMRSEPSGNS